MPAEQFLTLVGAFVVAAAVGWAGAFWYGGRIDRRHAARRERYLEGLRYLLDDEPDRALEVFRGLAALDDETVETRFALGSLYRRRGEVDRAIRIHQSIVSRDSLDPRHRDTALMELACDYFRAGLYDRAEQLFLQLADSGRDPAAALARLVRIYEHQHDWAQAAAAHERLRGVGLPQQPGAIAHYFCELAETAIAGRDHEAARELLRRARREQRDFGRSAILRGDLARRQGDPRLALQLYRRVVRRDFHLLPLVLPRLADAAAESGDPDALGDALGELVGRGGASRAEVAYAAILCGRYLEPPVLECVRDLLETDSDLRELAQAFLADGGGALSPPLLRDVAGALRNVFLRHARYRCSECGLDSSSFLWQCPGCKAWDTLRAIAALEFLPRAARPRAAT